MKSRLRACCSACAEAEWATMCEMLGFIESPLGFESRISEVIPGDDDGEIQTFSGACNTVLIQWEDKL